MQRGKLFCKKIEQKIGKGVPKNREFPFFMYKLYNLCTC